MKKEKSYDLILNPFKMPLKYEYVHPGVEVMQIPNIQNEEDAQKAQYTFAQTPGYQQIPEDFSQRLITKETVPQKLRVVLLADRLRSAQMCAARMCGMHHFGSEQCFGSDILACLSFEILKKHVCGAYPETWIEGSPQIFFGEKGSAEPFDDDWVNMFSSIDKEDRNIFVTLLPGQQNARLIHRLEFEWGFEVFRIWENDNLYQSTLLLNSITSQMVAGFNLSNATLSKLVGIVQGLQDYRGEEYSEWDLYQLVLNVKQRGKQATIKELNKVIGEWSSQKGNAQAELDRLIGLDSVKQQVKRILAVRQLAHRRKVQGKNGIETHNHLAFTGAPGTCKSVVARLVAKIMQEQGCGTGAFVEAGREDLIGKYLGQTSPKVAQLFELAKGGVLFIDEIGALQDTQDDIYVSEAINALVRHMELHPETMVIFATYPNEMRKFLGSNPGLSSRISRVLEFPSYTMEELWQIFVYLAEKQEFTVPKNCQKDVEDFFQKLKNTKGENFGNGREARRLLDACIEELALECQKNSDQSMNELTQEILHSAQELLLQQSGL